MTTKHKPLPCRGCLQTCGNYQRCHGRPWRLTHLPNEADGKKPLKPKAGGAI